MSVLHSLMEWMDEYEYDDKEEKIVIRPGLNEDRARDVYEQALDYVTQGEEDIEYPEEYLDELELKLGIRPPKWLLTSSKEYAKWAIDIAIACVKELSEDDKEYLLGDVEWGELHMGYGMYIRNRYIHHSRKHSVLSADDLSGDVLSDITSILSP